jgi:hypothetical protein
MTISSNMENIPKFKPDPKLKLKAAGIQDEIPPEVREFEWDVNCQAVGESPSSLK